MSTGSDQREVSPLMVCGSQSSQYEGVPLTSPDMLPLGITPPRPTAKHHHSQNKTLFEIDHVLYVLSRKHRCYSILLLWSDIISFILSAHYRHKSWVSMKNQYIYTQSNLVYIVMHITMITQFQYHVSENRNT